MLDITSSVLCCRRYEYKSRLRQCTQPTCTNILNKLPFPQGVRIISKKDIKFAANTFHVSIGKGVFGKCLFTRLGPLDVCLKIFNEESSSSHFNNEVSMLSKCCHANLPWLFGVSDGAINIIVLSYISFRGSAVNLFEAIYDTDAEHCLTGCAWKKILFGTASALVYLLNCGILHNDIKLDNIVIKSLPNDVLIDFGKSCMLKNGRKYHLSTAMQSEYLVKHPQIPPDVVKGQNFQSHASDIYAFGRVIKTVNENKMKIPYLHSLSMFCMDCNHIKRPLASDIVTSLS